MKTSRATIKIAPAADLHTRLREAQAELDTALLAGENTTLLRKNIARLQRQLDARAAADAAKQAEAERIELQAITTRASTIASEIAARMSTVLVDLQPPPAPWLPN